MTDDLTDAEIEVLSLLAEEAAEVVQCAMKILRHGPDSFDPTKPKAKQITNINHLCKELGDLEAAKELCNKYMRPFSEQRISEAKHQKMETIDKWLHNADTVGIRY